MKAEHWMDAMGQIDMNLVAEAEQRCLTTPVRRPRRKLLRWAACLAVALLLSLSVAFAAGVFDPLSQYFQGRTEADWDRFLSASTSVANDTVELRLEGAVADEHLCHLLVSFVGQTQAVKEQLTKHSAETQRGFQLHATAEDGTPVDSTQWTSGVYTEQRGFHSVASTPFAGADLTALVTVTFPEDLSLQEIENVCFTYEGLTLEVDVSQYLLPGYLLVPEHPAEGAGTVCYLSPIGFQCTVPGEGEVTLELLRTDGTVVEMGEDLGCHMAGYSGGDTQWFSGYWCAGSPLAVRVLDLEDYRGLRINGVSYIFPQPTE